MLTETIYTILGATLQRHGVTAILGQRPYMHVMHCELEACSQLLESGRVSDACSCRRLGMHFGSIVNSHLGVIMCREMESKI